MAFRIVRPTEGHRAAWERLFTAYADFYRKQQTPEMRESVWRWLFDEDSEVECFLALNGSGEAVGFAHFRGFARPLDASRGCFLDDLFVDPAVRGAGAAEALMEALGEEARRRDWSVVRWITAEDNYRARGMYDRVSTRTEWVTYEFEP